jgi:hypothetical protein
MSALHPVINVARDHDWIREQGTNNGPGVRMVQAVTGNKPPDPWCASFVSYCFLTALRGAVPFALSGGCDQLLTAMRRAGLERSAPVAPGVFFVMASPADAVHTGFVSVINGNRFWTIEGNASDPDKAATREGWGVFQRIRDMKPGKYVFCALPEVTRS